MAGKGEGRGREAGSSYSLGNLRRRGSFVGELLLIAAAFVMTSFFPFLWWPFVVQGADGILISPHSGWGLKCGGCFSPIDVKEQIS